MKLFQKLTTDRRTAAAARKQKARYTGLIQKNLDHQIICGGCKRLDFHLESYLQDQRESPRPALYSPSKLWIHEDFMELDACAARLGCATCRLIRQAILLACTTSRAADTLAHNSRGKRIFVAFEFIPSPDCQPPRPQIIVSILDSGIVQPARLACLGVPAEQRVLKLSHTPGESRNDKIFIQAQRWLSDCRSEHGQICGRLKYSSNENPTRLVHITSTGSQTMSRLVEINSDTVLEYAALSYIWGPDPPEDYRTKKQNLAHRLHNKLRQLPPALEDAIQITARLGISYIWIDGLCIVQDSDIDKAQELPNMHKYYGNATLTLQVASTNGVNESLLGKRAAWSLTCEPSRLARHWIVPYMRLNQVRASSPLAGRAWTLQEEYLSPRVIYWTPQRMYWSCACQRLAEQDDVSIPNPPPRSEQQDYAQAFLRSVVQGMHRGEDHARWLKIVEAYTRRNMSNRDDTFNALSGLAARYLDAHDSDSYIAGLWRVTFATDLAWMVLEPGRKYQSRDEIAPSWSWGSLPVCTRTKMVTDFSPASDFRLLELDANTFDTREHVDPITRGASVKSVEVCGRLRPFWPETASLQQWSDVTRTVNGKEEFYFDKPELSVFAADVQRGLVVSLERRKTEIVGQLDYVDLALRVAQGQLCVWALDIGQEVMLLLEKCGSREEFVRVGAAKRLCRANFFDTTETRQIRLK